MLELTQVIKTFNTGTVNEKLALDQVNLSVESGSFVTIIGGNGAGKSTLLNAIAGTFPIDSGNIILDGVELSHQKEYQRAKMIGHLFQDPLKGTAPSMSIEENLALAYGRHNRKPFQIGISKAEHAFFKEQLSQLDLGLENRMQTKMGLLSGGQRQAVTLIMATLSHPHLLLLDEHTSALDPKTAEKVLELTQRIVNEKKITTLMITHNISSALAFGSRTLMMDNGRIVIDLFGEERTKMTVESVLLLFEKEQGRIFSEDRALL